MKKLVIILVLSMFCGSISAGYSYRYKGTSLRSSRRIFPNIVRYKYERTEELFNKYVDKRIKFKKLFKGVDVVWKTQYKDTNISWDITGKIITVYVPLRGSPCDIPLERALVEYALAKPHRYKSWDVYRKLRKEVRNIKNECKE